MLMRLTRFAVLRVFLLYLLVCKTRRKTPLATEDYFFALPRDTFVEMRCKLL
jgi:hypothetical protein